MIPEDIKAEFVFGPLTCKPRILVYIDGEKKEEIDGADYTKINGAVTKFIPTVEE